MKKIITNLLAKILISFYIIVLPILILLQYLFILKRKSIQISPQIKIIKVNKNEDIDILVGDNLLRIGKEIIYRIKNIKIDLNVQFYITKFSKCSTWKKTLLICFFLLVPGASFLLIFYLIFLYIRKKVKF